MTLDTGTLTVAAGTGLLGATAGLVGTFAVVRRQSLQGDAVAHAALPGVMLAFLFGGRAPMLLLVGGAVAGWLALAGVRLIVRRSRVPFDAALGGTLTVFFGFGLALMKYVQREPDAATHGLERYLFGQAATLRTDDVRAMAVIGGGVAVVVVLLWKELKLLAFDPEYAAVRGWPVRRLDAVLTGLIVVTVVAGLQAVGVVLMSTLLIAPAAAARQWTDSLGPGAMLAVLIGTASAVGGTLASLEVGIPTGPAIVLVATVLAVGSLLIGPRGVLWGGNR